MKYPIPSETPYPHSKIEYVFKLYSKPKRGRPKLVKKIGRPKKVQKQIDINERYDIILVPQVVPKGKDSVWLKGRNMWAEIKL